VNVVHFCHVTRLALALLVATPASAAVTYVQHRVGSGNSSVATVSLGLPVGAQSLVVLGVTWFSMGPPTVTDSRGSTYVRAAGSTRVPGVSQSCAVFFATTPTAGINTITATFTGNPLTVELFAVEYRGADPSSPLDVVAIGTAPGGQSLDSGFLTTSSDLELLFALAAASNGVISAGPGYTSRGNGPFGSLAEDRFVTSIGSYNATGIGSLPNAGWVVQLAAFRAAGQDAGLRDAGVADAGSNDAGSNDAGVADAGSNDVGSSDAGSNDAGSIDAGSNDAGSDDAGSNDAGSGSGSDGGGVDAGPADDGDRDGGRADAGSAQDGDAGSISAPRELVVGCGCRAEPTALVVLVLLGVCRVARRRRVA
jgi:hypothetical protein